MTAQLSAIISSGALVPLDETHLVSALIANELTQACLPIGTKAAREIGFLDDAFGEGAEAFEAELRAGARRLAGAAA